MNSKRRKLKYIREKNHYRLGGLGVDYFIVSNEMLSDDTFIRSQIIRQGDVISKRYKMKFEVNVNYDIMVVSNHGKNTSNIVFKFKMIK